LATCCFPNRIGLSAELTTESNALGRRLELLLADLPAQVVFIPVHPHLSNLALVVKLELAGSLDLASFAFSGKPFSLSFVGSVSGKSDVNHVSVGGDLVCSHHEIWKSRSPFL